MSPAAGRPGGRRLALLVGIVVVAVVTWPLPIAGVERLPGSPYGEVDNHFHAFWLAVARLTQGPGPWTNLPAGWEIPLMDPVHLPVVLAAWPLGPTLAYRAVLLFDVALAAFGGWLLAREVTGSGQAALVGLAATAGAPFLAGIVDFGITESWTTGWLAIFAALALRYGRHGSLATLVGAAAALTAWLASGWYAAVFTVVAFPGVVLWAATLAPSGARRRRVLDLTVVGAAAAATRVPALLAYRASQGLWSARFAGLSDPGPLTDWKDNPTFGVDALAFLLPHPTLLPVSRTVYLGLPIVVLALWGVLAARRSPGARAAVGIAVALLVLACGHWLRVGGQPGPVPLRMPAGVLIELVPALRGLSHWYRAAGPATVFLAAAAAVGAHDLLRRLRRPAPAALLLVAVVVGEAVYDAPTPWPRRSYAVDPPAALVALPADPAGPAGLLQLPIDDVGAPPPARSRRPYDQWQPFHGRPIAENYEGPDAVFALSPVAAILNGLCGAPAPRGTPGELPDDLDLDLLREAGIGWIVVHPELARTPRPCLDALSTALGPPAVEDLQVVAWPLGPSSPPPR